MPLWILLIPLALFLLIFVLFALIDLWHAWRFRSGIFSSSFLILFFLAGTIGILLATYQSLMPIDWMQKIGVSLPNSSFGP